MNISKLAIENNRVTILVVLMVAVLGLTGYNNLSRNAMPPFTIRVATVVSSFPGASPERIEELITERIERVAQELPEVKEITSESRTGLSIVSVELDPSIRAENMQPVWDRLRRKIDILRPDLPDGLRSIQVKDDDIGVEYGIQVGLSGPGYALSELEDAAENIRDNLVTLPDAAEVEITGMRQEQIFVEFDNARLARYGLSANQLQQTISATNIVFAGGDVTLGDQRIVLEPSGNFESLDDLANTVVSLGNDQTAKLGEIARISRGYASPAERLVRLSGEQGLVVAVAVREGANLVELGEDIDRRLEVFNQTLPVGMEARRIASQDTFVQASVTNFVSNVVQSVAIVLAVMFLFLGWRTGLVVASLIPLAIVMTLMLMNIFDVGLNKVTLAALIMALGMLVDNAIVISESMMVGMEDGLSPKKAAYQATSELATPLLISSLTTSAAFLAFFLAENTMGEIMGNLFIVISFALLSSWILAMTVVTMLGVALIRVKQRGAGVADDPESATVPEAEATPPKRNIFERLNEQYGGMIYWSLKHPWMVLTSVIVLFFCSLSLFGRLPFIFFPDSDRNLITMNIELPQGTDIQRTTEVVEGMEAYINTELLTDDPEANGIASYTSFVGEGPKSYDLGYQPGEANSGYAHVLLNTTRFEANNLMIERLEQYGRENFPDADISVSPLSGGGGAAADVEIRITGPSADELFRISDNVKAELYQIPIATNITDNWGPKSKKVVVNIDPDKASAAGVTNQDIAVSLRTNVSGYTAGSYREGDESIPIVMRGRGAEEYRVDDLQGLNVFAQGSGANVPLPQVADVSVDWQYAKINHRDLMRTLAVRADAVVGYTATDVTQRLIPRLDSLAADWPVGYDYSLGGESERSREAMGAVAAKLPLAGFIIIVLLMLQFNSFRKTGIVLATIPLGIIGVILGLLLFQSYFGFMGFLGVISLSGILINNAIVLIDRIEIEEKAGKTEFRAIVDACQQRFRPILLTTFTTALGLIPLYLGGGLIWEPMAIAIMVGLLFGTVITLIFVPITYKLLFGIREKQAPAEDPTYV
ncbi:multidrug efflux pump subunit AcrB [Neolewinella xylanilytica]|uniref:Multidrug efflux pump subunit AcrB n=1 Tax=Neolewinella xylanilytica TaxID=1514080 RepID=A0A2S6I212_9BACT|nr:efflux RND transporter permease subunit [Neolewinella xylanilytica]PPK85216.1 multidrug efflux pump subunit AcrB [Neolewinella xylanilytica]